MTLIFWSLQADLKANHERDCYYLPQLEQRMTIQKVFKRWPVWFLDKSSLNNHNQGHAYHRAKCFLQIHNCSQDPLISFEVLGWKILRKSICNNFNTKLLLYLLKMSDLNGTDINLDVKLAGRIQLLHLPLCMRMHVAILSQTIKWQNKSKKQKHPVYTQVSFFLHILLQLFNSLMVSLIFWDQWTSLLSNLTPT